jgi:hypothetical protein
MYIKKNLEKIKYDLLTKTPLLQGIGERERILFAFYFLFIYIYIYIYIFQKGLKTRNKILSSGVFIIGPNRVGLLEFELTL